MSFQSYRFLCYLSRVSKTQGQISVRIFAENGATGHFLRKMGDKTFNTVRRPLKQWGNREIEAQGQMGILIFGEITGLGKVGSGVIGTSGN